MTIEVEFNQVNFAAVHFIDGIIRLGGMPVVAAIDNRSGNAKNFYTRNVYITGGDQLVQSGTNAAVSGAGTWELINEYSHCYQDPINAAKASWDLIDGTPTRVSGPLNNDEVFSVIDHAPPPDDLMGWRLEGHLPLLSHRGFPKFAPLTLQSRAGSVRTAQSRARRARQTPPYDGKPVRGADEERRALPGGRRPPHVGQTATALI